jgi:replicative DNA helicase
MAFEISGGGSDPNENRIQRFRRRDSSMEMAFRPGEKPHDIDTEKAVLAGIILYNDVFSDIQHVLTAGSFFLPAHQTIYESMVQLAFKNKPIDLTTLMGNLRECGKLDFVGGAPYLADLASTPSTSSHARDYAVIVADLAWRRRLLEAAEAARTLALKAGDTRDIAQEVEKRIFDAAQERKKTQLAKVGDLLHEVIEEFEKRADSGGVPDPTIVPTGFRDLDECLTGFRPGQLIVLAAGPGTGKTALSVNIMHNVSVKQKKTVLFFSLEMTQKEIVERMMSFAAGVDSTKLRKGNLSPEDFNNLYYAADELNTAPLFIDDRSLISPYDILAQARKLVSSLRLGNPDLRLDLVVVDYIQIMKAGAATESRSVEVAAITGGLKAIAKELGVPVLALSQLNRQRSKREGTPESKKPQLSDLRDSGAIEQDADVVMFIHREMGSEVDSRAPSEAEIIVAKHRAGPTKTVKLTWLGSQTRFSDWAPASFAPPEFMDHPPSGGDYSG